VVLMETGAALSILPLSKGRGACCSCCCCSWLRCWCERAGGVEDAVAVPAIVAVAVETRGWRVWVVLAAMLGLPLPVASGSVCVVVEARGRGV